MHKNSLQVAQKSRAWWLVCGHQNTIKTILINMESGQKMSQASHILEVCSLMIMTVCKMCGLGLGKLKQCESPWITSGKARPLATKHK